MVNPGFPPAPVPAQRQGNGLAIAGMVMGILAIVLFWTSFIDLIIAILAIVFSIVGLRKARTVGVGRGAAMAGLITGIVGLVLATILIVIALVAVKGFTEYMKKSKASEASLQLNRMSKRAKTYFGENGTFPQGNAPLTPAEDCCKQPNVKCAANPSDWDNPVWKALEFSIDEPGNYRYDYQSDGKTFVAHAVGDLDCDGTPATYTLQGSVEGGNPSTNLTPPPAGVY
jgi:type II secretory pathway pseudopilin PulG